MCQWRVNVRPAQPRPMQCHNCKATCRLIGDIEPIDACLYFHQKRLLCVWIGGGVTRSRIAHWIISPAHHDRACICASKIAASEGPNPTMPTKPGGGIGISRLMGFQRCRQYRLLFTYCEWGGCSCITHSSSSQNRSLTKHISSQFGQRRGVETETCSQPGRTSAVMLSLQPQGPCTRKWPQGPDPGALASRPDRMRPVSSFSMICDRTLAPLVGAYR